MCPWGQFGISRERYRLTSRDLSSPAPAPLGFGPARQHLCRSGEAQTTTALGDVPVTPREDVAVPPRSAKRSRAGEPWLLGTPRSFGISGFMGWSSPRINNTGFNAIKQIEI